MGLSNSKSKKRKSAESTKPKPAVRGAVEAQSQRSRQETLPASAKPLNAARTAPHHGVEEERVRTAIQSALRRAYKDAFMLLEGKTLPASPSAALLTLLYKERPKEIVGALRQLFSMSKSYPDEIAGFLRCFVGLIDKDKVPGFVVGHDPLLFMCSEAETIMSTPFATNMRDTAGKLHTLAAVSPRTTSSYFRPLTLL